MKKWTYLVAAGMLLGAAPVFTGCIDNDEPEGITILRGAKAELLKAKVAVEEANAIRIKAEAAKLEAEAIVEKAKAEVQLAKAEKIKAEAEQIAALTESEKAKYAAEIAKIEAEIAQIQAETQAAIDAAAQALQLAEIEYQKALEELKQAEYTTTVTQWNALIPWKEAYEAANEEYFEKSKALLAAQRQVTLAETTEVTIADRRAAERQLKLAEAKLAKAEEGLDLLNSEMEKANGLQPGEIPTEIVSLKEQIEKLEQEIAMVEVEKAEAERDNPEYEKLQTLRQAVTDAKNTEIAIDEFKNTINPDEAIYWLYDLDQIIVEKGTYSFNDLDAYNDAKFYLNSLKQNAFDYMLDADDVKWNEASINEMTTELNTATKEFNEKTGALFNAAVAAYNEGKGVDATKYINYAKLVEAVNAYNEKADALDADKAELAALEEAMETALEELNDKAEDESLYDAYEICTKEIKAAEAKREATVEAADATYNNTVASYFNKWQDAEDLVKQREKEELLALEKKNADPTNADLQMAYTTAQANTQNAITAATAAENAYYTQEQKASAEREATEKIAIAQEELDVQTAYNKRDKSIRNWSDNLDPVYKAEYAELEAKYNEAVEAYNDKREEMADNEVYQVVVDVIADVRKAANEIDVYASSDQYVDKEAFDDELDACLNDISAEKCYDLDIAKLFIVKDAKNYLIQCSYNAYGSLAEDAMHDGYWPGVRITPLDKAGVHEILAKYYPNIKERYYNFYYRYFRDYGDILSIEANIEIAKAFIANSSKFEELIEAIDTQVANLDEAYEAQKEVIDLAEEAVATQEDVIGELTYEFDLKKTELTAEKDLLDKIKLAYEEVPLSEDESYTEESIKGLKQLIQANIEKQELAIYDAETNVQIYTEMVETLGEPDATKLEWAQYQLKIAELEEARAKELLNKADEELQAAIAAIIGTEENE